MVAFDKTLIVRAPRERVFAFLAEHAPEWIPAHLLGTEYATDAAARTMEEKRRFGWRQERGEFEQNEGEFVLDDAPGGTRVRLHATVEPPFVLPRLATDEELASDVSRRYDRALLRLKRTLET